MAQTPNYTGMHPALEAPGVFGALQAGLIVEILYVLVPRLPAPYNITVEQGLTMRDGEDNPQRYQPDASIRSDDEHPSSGTATATLPTTTPAFSVTARTKPQRYLSIRDGQGQLITTIEILSPANKSKRGMREFDDKQSSLAAQGINLVEIDLLRQGHRRWGDERTETVDYLMSVYRAGDEDASVWTAGAGEALPVLPIPLRWPDADVSLPLEVVLLTYLEKSGLGARYLASG